MNTLNLHTDGKEYFIAGTTNEYIGFYNLIDDVPFSGRSFDSDSIALEKMPDSNKQYVVLNDKELKFVTAIVPTPKDDDYKRGWFQRYFARKSNDKTAPYIEINEQDFNEVNSGARPYYVGVSLRWKISGPLHDRGPISGVEDTNYRTVSALESQYPGISFRLQNHVEYWEGE